MDACTSLNTTLQQCPEISRSMPDWYPIPLSAAGTNMALWDAIPMTTEVAGCPVLPIDWCMIYSWQPVQVMDLMDFNMDSYNDNLCSCHLNLWIEDNVLFMADISSSITNEVDLCVWVYLPVRGPYRTINKFLKNTAYKLTHSCLKSKIVWVFQISYQILEHNKTQYSRSG